jgi:hypothetical protein
LRSGPHFPSTILEYELYVTLCFSSPFLYSSKWIELFLRLWSVRVETDNESVRVSHFTRTDITNSVRFGNSADESIVRSVQVEPKLNRPPDRVTVG